MWNFIRKGGCVFLFISVYMSGAQNLIIGVIKDENLKPIVNASVTVLEIKNKGAVSDFDGRFTIELPNGLYTLEISHIGFTSVNKIVNATIENGVVKVILNAAVSALNDVIINTKTEALKEKEKPFEVEVLEIKQLKNNSIDVNAVLATIPGVNLRQSGGLGSAFDFSLNGLSGKQVKFFMDGIPLENFGSSFSLNNFPATLIERAEVYKGVVPINLGSDALGGAINIITNRRKNDFLDVSYDFGSFNTNRATVNGQYYGEKGFVLQLSSFYNYSDNDYTIDGIEVRDDLGNDTGELRDNVRRFHDAYSSQMISIKAGLVDQKILDRLLFGLIASANENEIQHSIDPQNPFGEVTTNNNIVSASIDFEKKKLLKDKANLKVYVSITKNREKVRDTSSRKYDWFGNFIERDNQELGEFESSKTRFQFSDNLHLVNAFFSYNLNKNNTINFNYSKNHIKRVGEDPERVGRIAFQDPHIVNKNILGLSYGFNLLKSKWNTTVFSKFFLLNSQGIIQDFFTNVEADQFTEFNNTFEEIGYGLASAYKFSETLQIKSSFESTFRIPEGYEVFGDGFLLKSNPELLPEESTNMNLGALFSKTINAFKFNIDSNVFLRHAKNFIAIQSEGIFSRYYNTTNVRISGIEGELKTLYNNTFFLDINATYQNIIDQNAGANSNIDFLENQRIANIPYLFGNAIVGARFKNVIATKDSFNVSWSSYFVNEFPLTSFIEGNPEDRDIIPEQLSHNLQLGYSFKTDKYNVSLLARNITDAKFYDNFEVQQAGRAFYLKLRYYITN